MGKKKSKGSEAKEGPNVLVILAVLLVAVAVGVGCAVYPRMTKAKRTVTYTRDAPVERQAPPKNPTGNAGVSKPLAPKQAAQLSVGGDQVQAGQRHFRAGNFEACLRSYQEALRLLEAEGDDEQWLRVVSEMVTKWKKPCSALDHNACDATWLTEDLARFGARADDLATEVVFSIGYIHNQRSEKDLADKFFLMADGRDDRTSLIKSSVNINRAIIARINGDGPLSAALDKERWIINEFEPTARNTAGSACDKPDVLFCSSWDELWRQDSIPEPIVSAELLPIKSPMRFVEQHSTGDEETKVFCAPPLDTGHLVLRDVTVEGRDLWIYDDCNVFSCGLRLPFRSERPGPPRQKIDIVKLERAAILPQKHMTNYYHFFIEGMTSMLMLLDSVAPYQPFARMPNQKKQFVVLTGASRQGERQFAYELLLLLGRARPDIALSYQWFDASKRYEVDELHMVDWFPSLSADSECPPDTEEFNSSYHGFNPPCELLQQLRSTMVEALLPTDQRDAIVFFSRNTSPRNDRRMLNDHLLLEPLDNAIMDFNVAHGTRYRLLVHEGQLTLEEQMRQMHRARIVFGTHGAGFSNAAVAREGTGMFEIPIHGADVHQFFKYIAMCGGLEYHRVSQFSTGYYTNLELESPRDDAAIAELIASMMAFLERNVNAF